MEIIKTMQQPTTEKLVGGLVGKFIHVPTNIHMIATEEGTHEEVNAWFAGRVAGYEKAVLAFDYSKGEYMEKPKVLYNVLLTDGMGYVLSHESSSLEIREITEEEYAEMLAEFHAKQALQMDEAPPKKLITPEEDRKVITLDRKIIMPGEY